MLPWELITRLNLDLLSLVRLSQTNRAWRHAFSEEDWREMVLENFSSSQALHADCRVLNWRSAAAVSSRSPHYQQVSVPFSKTNWPVYVDVPLPADFYCLCKRTGNMLENPPIHFCDNGFFSNDGFVNLSEDLESFYDPYIWYEDGILSSSYGIELRVDPVCPCMIRSSAGILLVMFETRKSGSIRTGLYIKYRETKGREPDVKLDNLESHVYGSSSIYLFDDNLLIQQGSLFFTVAKNGLNPVQAPKRYMATKGALLWHNDTVLNTDSALWGENIGAGSTVEVVQDQEFTQYAVSYNSEGLVQRLVDVENGRYMDLDELVFPTPIALVGVSYEQVGVYTYSPSYLAYAILSS